MGNDLVQQAAVGIAGFGRDAAAAALQRVGVAREVEAALGFIGIVAGVAGVFEQRMDVILIRDFLLRLAKRDGEDPSGKQQ